MSKLRHKKIVSGLLFTMVAVTLVTGCGKSESDGASGREIHKDGSIEATIVCEFDESLYNVADLKAMMDEEIDAYNFDHAGDKVSAGDVSCSDGILTCVMKYASDEDYAGFNTRRFVIESLDDALASDTVKISVKSVKDMTQADLDTIDKTDSLSVLITDETGYVTFPGKVRYISDGVEVISGRLINVTDNMDGLAYIIYENK